MIENKIQYEWILKGIDCGSCAAKVERGVSKIDGIVNSNVDYIAETLSFEVADENESGVLSQVKQEKAAIWLVAAFFAFQIMKYFLA